MNCEIIPFLLVALATVATHAAEPLKPEQTPDLDKLAGQLLCGAVVTHRKA